MMPYAITCREIDSLTGCADVQVERQGVKEFQSCFVPPHLCDTDMKFMWITGARTGLLILVHGGNLLLNCMFCSDMSSIYLGTAL